jgi:hypothetical protein
LEIIEGEEKVEEELQVVAAAASVWPPYIPIWIPRPPSKHDSCRDCQQIKTTRWPQEKKECFLNTWVLW